MEVEFLDFYADWCGPCKVMEPTLEALEKELGDKVKITKIDVDSESEASMKYGVMSIPTYIVLKDGQEVERFVGATSKDILKTKIEAHLA
ncbi:MAG: thioredoxin [bacterium]|nr:thioredoxin [bacterium]